MLILAIDTSAVASAALVSDDAPESVLASFATEDTRTHAEVLAPGIDGLLDGTDSTSIRPRGVTVISSLPSPAGRS